MKIAEIFGVLNGLIALIRDGVEAKQDVGPLIEKALDITLKGGHAKQEDLDSVAVLTDQWHEKLQQLLPPEEE